MQYIIIKIFILIFVIFNSCTVTQQESKDINYLNEELPGLSAKLFGRGIISTEHYEHGSPAFSPSYDRLLNAALAGNVGVVEAHSIHSTSGGRHPGAAAHLYGSTYGDRRMVRETSGCRRGGRS